MFRQIHQPKTIVNWQDAEINSALQHICGTICVDINGTKKPNQWGKDNFLFYVTKNGILPVGVKDDRIDPVSRCRIYGWSCAAWILQKENMDYLKHDIFWD